MHPTGPNTNTCPDFQENPDAEPEELWEPEGASYYNGELILQPRQRWTPEQQLDLLDTHPLFTGRCPRCQMTDPQYETPPVDWDCSECGWMIRCEAMVRSGSVLVMAIVTCSLQHYPGNFMVKI